jgi:hypothetical protein
LLTIAEIVAPTILGLALVYGIMRNRGRSDAERRYTDAATKRLYDDENRRSHR